MTFIFALFFYVAVAIFVVGFMGKIWKYGSTPAPLKIPQTPAPVTASGVGSRMFQEVIFFKSLFKSNGYLWLGGYLFHLGLLFVILKHLRFFFPSTPSVLSFLATIDILSGFVLMGALMFLFILRLVVDRHFYISVANDYLLLVLLMGIAFTGLLSRFWDGAHVRADVPSIKEFVVGLASFGPGAVPVNAVFLIHFSLVMLLLIYFPFSKLMHAGGIFFSPTRNQIDNPREKRWVNPWAGERSTMPAPATAPVMTAEEPSDG